MRGTGRQREPLRRRALRPLQDRANSICRSFGGETHPWPSLARRQGTKERRQGVRKLSAKAALALAGFAVRLFEVFPGPHLRVEVAIWLHTLTEIRKSAALRAEASGIRATGFRASAGGRTAQHHPQGVVVATGVRVGAVAGGAAHEPAIIEERPAAQHPTNVIGHIHIFPAISRVVRIRIIRLFIVLSPQAHRPLPHIPDHVHTTVRRITRR